MYSVRIDTYVDDPLTVVRGSGQEIARLAEALLYKIVNGERLEALQTTTFSFWPNDRTLPGSKLVSGSFHAVVYQLWHGCE